MCLQFLETAHHFTVCGVTRTVGGPRSVSAAVRQLASQRMQAWARLAKIVVAAEHPCFELIAQFHVFDLSKWPDVAAGGGYESFGPSQMEAIRRLSSSFDVDEGVFLSQFADIGSLAHARWQKTQCVNLDAWVWAMQVTGSRASRMRHPADQLSIVLSRYSAMTASDSVLERDFSRLQRFEVSGSEVSEENICLLRLMDPALDEDVLKRVAWRY